jgi:hypothetical protein
MGRKPTRNNGIVSVPSREIVNGNVLYHRIPEFQPVMQQRFLANSLAWLTTK